MRAWPLPRSAGGGALLPQARDFLTLEDGEGPEHALLVLVEAAGVGVVIAIAGPEPVGAADRCVVDTSAAGRAARSGFAANWVGCCLPQAGPRSRSWWSAFLLSFWRCFEAPS